MRRKNRGRWSIDWAGVVGDFVGSLIESAVDALWFW